MAFIDSLASLAKPTSSGSENAKQAPVNLGMDSLIFASEGLIGDYIKEKNYVIGGTEGSAVISPQDWYKTYPYQLMIIDKKASSGVTRNYIYSLPIPPDALNYRMISASNVSATMGGVVEETSETVFWNISLTGTTAIAVSREDTDKSPNGAEGFRQTYDAGGILGRLVSSVLGGLSSLAGRADSIVNAGKSLFGNSTGPEKASAFSNGVAGALENQPSFTRSGVNGDAKRSNGYTEIHKLHMFLNLYAKLKDTSPDRFELKFVSQKDNMAWQVIVKDFSFQKSANQPMLYRYSIQLQGFNMVNASSFVQRTAIDRFGKDGDLATANSLTATGAITKASGLVKGMKQFTSNPGSALKLPGVF